ncbi:MAG: OmpA family protein [Sulfuritalea sp.]|nr:OmpA family protein [Sulfuritalea sp.]
MFSRTTARRRAKEEGEKPFWISYADLMTAMMMLFFIVMAVSLIVITNPGPEQDHEKRVRNLCEEIKRAAEGVKDVTVDCQTNRINFGPQAFFAVNSFGISSSTKTKLREVVPVIISVANKNPDRQLLRRVVIEGYASKSGTYLHNLQLSMRRAEEVLCGLFENPGANERGLTLEEKQVVRDLFLVGGYSFNDAGNRSSHEAQRVEFRLEFLGYKDGASSTKSESRPPSDEVDGFGTCRSRVL